MLRAGAIAALILLSLGRAAPGQDRAALERSAAENRKIAQALDDFVAVRDFHAPELDLKLFLGLFYERMAARGLEPTVVVNRGSFKHPKRDDVLNESVKLPVEIAARMKMAALLRLALAEARAEATFLVRNGTIEILHAKLVTPAVLLQERVCGAYQDIPLPLVLQHLSDQSGLSVALDPRTGDKGKAKITLTLRNDMSLRSALHMVAEMAQLKVVQLPEGILITTPQHAEALRQELAASPAGPAKKLPRK